MQKPIRLYALSTCSHCKATKKLLNDFKIPYECQDVDLLTGEERNRAIQEVRELNPQCSFPTLLVGERVVVGHREDEIREALGL